MDVFDRVFAWSRGRDLKVISDGDWDGIVGSAIISIMWAAACGCSVLSGRISRFSVARTISRPLRA